MSEEEPAGSWDARTDPGLLHAQVCCCCCRRRCCCRHFQRFSNESRSLTGLELLFGATETPLAAGFGWPPDDGSVSSPELHVNREAASVGDTRTDLLFQHDGTDGHVPLAHPCSEVAGLKSVCKPKQKPLLLRSF